MRAVKCDCLVLSPGRRYTIYCLDSSPQFCRVCLMIQRLHKLSPLLYFMFVRYSGDLIVHLLQGGRGRVSGSEVISCSGSVLSRCCPEGRWCDAALIMMARNIFFPFCQLVGSRLLFRLSSISLRYRFQFSFFRLKLLRWGVGLIVRSICNLTRIGRLSDSRFVVICQLVEVISKADANKTSGQMGWRCLVALVVSPN